MKNRTLRGLLTGGISLMTLPSIAVACSVCLSGVDDSTAGAFNASVLFLMATPYLVVGSIAGWLAYSYRRAAKKREPTEAAQSLVQLALNQEETGR